MNISAGSHKPFILVVDRDCYRGRSLLSELRALGCYASLASSGSEALQYVGENEPDAVAVDWSLPDMTGLELARRIKVLRFSTKVVLGKGVADWRSLRQTLEVGGEDLLSHPLSGSTVLRCLERSRPCRVANSVETPARVLEEHVSAGAVSGGFHEGQGRVYPNRSLV